MTWGSLSGEERNLRIERNALPSRGARFFKDGRKTLFEFVIDPTNVIGPREATKADQDAHPEAWAALKARG